MYALRGMHVDNGRKYFTPAWLRDHIRELAYLKMNTFHLHLSDRKGFRIRSPVPSR
jgi:hexosaminidase